MCPSLLMSYRLKAQFSFSSVVPLNRTERSQTNSCKKNRDQPLTSEEIIKHGHNRSAIFHLNWKHFIKTYENLYLLPKPYLQFRLKLIHTNACQTFVENVEYSYLKTKWAILIFIKSIKEKICIFCWIWKRNNISMYFFIKS